MFDFVYLFIYFHLFESDILLSYPEIILIKIKYQNRGVFIVSFTTTFSASDL